jgi:5-hydroxyisourate hydrolase
MSSPITTHILDTAGGHPAAGVAVVLFRWRDDTLAEMGRAESDAEGRIMTGLIDASEFEPGEYQIRFETAAYFAARGVDAFYPRVTIDFVVSPGQDHYHVPLLLAPFGFSTYRGS